VVAKCRPSWYVNMPKLAPLNLARIEVPNCSYT
jgi:hypothetical protein